MKKPQIYYSQSGVIPYRVSAENIKVLLITNRSRKRWVIPKGIIEAELSPAESAAQEAWEEAGLTGRLSAAAVGRYDYYKWGGICHVEVFLLQVEQIHDDWPEASSRDRCWLTPAEAAQRVDEPELKALIANPAIYDEFD